MGKLYNVRKIAEILFDVGIFLFVMVCIINWFRNNTTSCECPPTDDYREQQYNEIKLLYDHDEALLRYGKRIDENTRMLPLEYSNFNS